MQSNRWQSSQGRSRTRPELLPPCQCRYDAPTLEEIARVASVGAPGHYKDPTDRWRTHSAPRSARLVDLLVAIPGIHEVSLTTNAARLAALAAPLKAAGLQRVNISLDTLRRDRMAQLARRDCFHQVMAGIDAALAHGLTPLKFNAVVMRGVNEDELCDLLEFAYSKAAQMRFIEYMPMGVARMNDRNRLVAVEEMQERLGARFDLVREASVDPHDPSRSWQYRRTGARVGFITSMTENFCAWCNRLRLTADGGLRPCLHQNAEVNVRAVLRAGGSDENIADLFREAVGLKWAGHQMSATIPLHSSKEMVAIGG